MESRVYRMLDVQVASRLESIAARQWCLEANDANVNDVES